LQSLHLKRMDPEGTSQDNASSAETIIDEWSSVKAPPPHLAAIKVGGITRNGYPRDPNPHQAFGNGPHHCAGAHLSRRTVGDILLPVLFARFPHMKLLDPSVVRWHGFGFRGPLNLPVLLQ
jgi:hypothetical protein